MVVETVTEDVVQDVEIDVEPVREAAKAEEPEVKAEPVITAPAPAQRCDSPDDSRTSAGICAGSAASQRLGPPCVQL